MRVRAGLGPRLDGVKGVEKVGLEINQLGKVTGFTRESECSSRSVCNEGENSTWLGLHKRGLEWVARNVARSGVIIEGPGVGSGWSSFDSDHVHFLLGP